MVFPLFDELYLVVGVFAEVDIDLHDVFEVLGDDGDPDVVLIVYDDVEYLGREYFALDEEDYIGFVEFELLLDLAVDVVVVVLVAEVLVFKVFLVHLLYFLQYLLSVLYVEPH